MEKIIAVVTAIVGSGFGIKVVIGKLKFLGKIKKVIAEIRDVFREGKQAWVAADTFWIAAQKVNIASDTPENIELMKNAFQKALILHSEVLDVKKEVLELTAAIKTS